MSSRPTLDTRALRHALGQFATGVTIVSCLDAGGRPVGLTANSFNALSLDPPLVLWSLRRESPSLEAFDRATHFAVNVLGEAQVDLSRRFAATREDKFSDVAWAPGLGGAPVLAGCAATFQCETAQRQDAGDHRLYIGRVLELQAQPVPPLVYHAGHYHLLGEIL